MLCRLLSSNITYKYLFIIFFFFDRIDLTLNTWWDKLTQRFWNLRRRVRISIIIYLRKSLIFTGKVYISSVHFNQSSCAYWHTCFGFYTTHVLFYIIIWFMLFIILLLVIVKYNSEITWWLLCYKRWCINLNDILLLLLLFKD